MCIRDSQHLEAGFARRRHARRQLNALGEEFVGLVLQPFCRALSFVAQKRDDLCLTARSLLLGDDAPQHTRKVESFKGRAPLDGVDLFRHPLRHGDVSEGLGYRSCFRLSLIHI